MSRDLTRAHPLSQEDAAEISETFQQPLALELRARQLSQRFVLTPESARTFAALAFAGELSA
ncbi:hypothetical protein [Bradyrhizobium yuanmingense]|uniref:hypothetical protein n=1 Tax=Bradyrhizobium yuanmingense TaxID=108015 RepID=UPI0004B7B99B|nr:hypothetical protein [Bradyrhizobium yuanmingense]